MSEKSIGEIVFERLMADDFELQADVTSFSITVKKAMEPPYSCRGCITNQTIQKAFEGPKEGRKFAEEAIKDMLWIAFKNCYEKKC